MSAKRKQTTGSDEAAQALLSRYRCPVPFHMIRTRFLGAIVSPVGEVSPLTVVKDLWGGNFPEFDSLGGLNQLLEILVLGLWNRLAMHQKRNNPFCLTRATVPETVKGLSTISLMRRQEIDGFVDGLFGAEECIELPERGYRALGELGEIRAMLAGVYELVNNRHKASCEDNASQLLGGIERLTKIA